MTEPVQAYMYLPLGFADAATIVIAERLRSTELFSPRPGQTGRQAA